jgi:proteasome lid subunit RPN8/RPN11
MKNFLDWLTMKGDMQNFHFLTFRWKRSKIKIKNYEAKKKWNKAHSKWWELEKKKQVGDNPFNQELKDAKEKEHKHSRKSSNDEQQETKIKISYHSSPNHPEKWDTSNEDMKSQYQETFENLSWLIVLNSQAILNLYEMNIR